jgi:hypothetical protein
MGFKKGKENYNNVQGPWNKGTRDWKLEIASTAARLEMCVVYPEHLTANTRVRCSCSHGVIKDTTVGRFVDRKFCCKSQASKAHNPEVKRKAAEVAWKDKRELLLQKQRERWSRPGEKEKHSKAMLSALGNLRETGWYNPGYGYGPSGEERKVPGTLYLIRYLDESGTHFKIGITKLTLAQRFRKGQLISILALHHATLGECFDLEQSLLKWAKSEGYRYSSPTTTELLRPEACATVLSRLRSVTKSYNS